MKNSEALARQTVRGNKMMLNSIITMTVGAVLVVLGFFAFGQFANVAVGASILGLGWFAIALGSNFYLKAKSTLESARLGIIKLF